MCNFGPQDFTRTKAQPLLSLLCGVDNSARVPMQVDRARPDMWVSSNQSQRFYYPRPLTQVKARPWSPPRPPSQPKRSSSVMDSDWRPGLLVQAEEWEREADELLARIEEDVAKPSGPTFLPIERDLGMLLIKLEKMKVKVEHQINEWDRTGDGKVSKGEFRLHMRELGLEHPTDEVDELFEKYDREYEALNTSP